METICIQGLQVNTLIGVYDWERTQNTSLLFDIELDADLTRAMSSDDVKDTIDYANVAEFIQHTAATCEFELLEALGNKIMESVLANYPALSIRLAITKPNILPAAKQVIVRMSRSQTR
ncbi:dihydroneopterin aldolase [Alteromonas sp. ASW11-130]|uniref:dihydroneopterin aldolase n=1 Tax=Alteromonas sp. ASW11-130 TaxID=3015775 RepID=UPI002241D83F|nr:dihydroneopterin aldolase [Alteromonas sp. ASW11-130]MCW8090504.1 dihydroneopterin aldolase [Alteromonas sp. ASW11-130]